MPPGSQSAQMTVPTADSESANSLRSAIFPRRQGLFAASALTVVAMLTAPAHAQEVGEDTAREPDYFWTGGENPEPDPAPPFRIEEADEAGAIAFEADELGYENGTETVIASGDVVLRRGNQQLEANEIRWDRTSGLIVASGNVRLRDEAANTIYTDRLELTDELRAGAMENLLLVLDEGARLAAREGTRNEDGTVRLDYAAYSPCRVTTPDGCPRDPSWRIVAKQVNFDPDSQTVKFKGAKLELFGAPILPLMGITIRTDGQPVSGLKTPNLRFSESNGVEVIGEYYWRLAPNREVTLGASVYSDVAPMLSASYAALTEDGAYQVTGYATNSSRIPIGGDASDILPGAEESVRGYFDANGRFQLDENWSVTGSVRLASDRTFLRRYDISRDDRLRSMINVERIDDDSYLSIAGWATQTLRTGEEQGLVPFAMPLIDYRRRLSDPVLGGKVMLQANSLMLERSDGQDTQRAFTSVEWSLRKLTGMGQEVTFTALARGDVYHTDETALTSVDFYRGREGWETRAMAIGAVDVKWPLVGGVFGGTQVLTPRVQFVASPAIRNLAIPNEDARAVDLEDSNLFALNRFPGYDRVEDGARVTYGFDWRWTAPGWRIKTTLGQSYRLSDQSDILPDGTGLTSRTSDVVGRSEVRFRDFVSFTHRFRLDKDNLAVRRNEFDVAVGSRKTYIEAGYLRLDRNIPDTLEDLGDREELRVAGRVAFANYWSLFGSTVVNLTDREEDPSFTSDGFDPLRTRLGVAYEDECMSIALTWRRDSFTTGDARKGNTFLFRFSLKGLGL